MKLRTKIASFFAAAALGACGVMSPASPECEGAALIPRTEDDVSGGVIFHPDNITQNVMYVLDLRPRIQAKLGFNYVESRIVVRPELYQDLPIDTWTNTPVHIDKGILELSALRQKGQMDWIPEKFLDEAWQSNYTNAQLYIDSQQQPYIREVKGWGMTAGAAKNWRK